MFADLAGSERVGKTEQAKWIDRSSHQLNWTAMEGIMTNFDLYQFGMQLDIIAARIKAGKHAAYDKKDSLLSMLLKKSLDGDALTSLVVCLSQAPINGGETWYSLQYGAKFTGLITRVLPTKPSALRAALKAIHEEIPKLQSGIKALEATPVGRKNKWYAIRKNRLAYLRDKKALLSYFLTD